MSDQEIPVAEFTGTVKIGEALVPCAVLYHDTDNPVRVFWHREIVGLLTGNKKGGFDRYLKPANLQPYLPEKFREKALSETVLPFKIKGRGNIAQAFEATDLIDLCQMYMRAKYDRKLHKSQMPIAAQAEIVVFAFAKTGVIAVIDEATDYQFVRDRLALNKILDKYLHDEAQKWAKKFPDEFYKQIFRLNNWEFSPKGFNKRPSIIGKWTREIVYARFPEGMLVRLDDMNPLTESGYGKHKHHQFLTDEIGNPELKDYISNVVFLMQSSSNWRKFKQLFARALGKEYQPSMFDDDI